VRILHTSDWHVGKVLKGVPRLDEQRCVLAEIVSLAAEHQVDLVLVAGDLFESAAPPAEAQAAVWSTVLGLRATGAEVIVIAGNHDNALMLDALGPLAAAAGVRVLGRPRRPEEGGVVTFETRGGERAQVASLPFVSQRHVVRAAELMANDAAQNAGAYAERYRSVMAALCGGFAAGTVNVVVAHGMVRGGVLGGGERDAQTIEDYWVDPTAFPPAAQYVALGHLHRAQQLPGAAPIWYCGSPIQLDFGETADTKQVLVVDVEAGKPARVEALALRSPRRLRTLEGTVADLAAMAPSVGDDLLRVVVTEPGRAGLAAEVKEALPNAVDIRLQKPEEAPQPAARRRGRSAHELFADYLAESGVDDDRLVHLFARLLDEIAEEQP